MTLHDFLRTLRHGWWIVVACLLVGALGGLVVGLTQAPRYSSVSTLFITTTSPAAGTQLSEARQADNAFVQSRATTYANLATTSTVLEAAAKSVLGISVSDLRRDVTSAARPSSNLIDITAVATTSTRSADEANAVAQALTSAVSSLESANSPSGSQVVMKVVQPASPPVDPVSPQLRSTALIGLIVGLAVGVAITVLVQAISGRIRSPRDVAVVSGLVPTSIPEARGSVASIERREAYRSLRINLRHRIGARGAIAVVPILAGTTARPFASELAGTFGEIGARVLLIDADQRPDQGPRHRSVSAESAPGPGLAEVVAGLRSINDVVVPAGEPNLWSLPVGRSSEDASQLLSQDAVARVIDTAVSDFDYVLIVAPPILERSVAAALASCAQACVLTMEARATRRDDLLFALERLVAVDVINVSLVLDNVRRGDMLPAGGNFVPAPDAAETHSVAEPARPAMASTVPADNRAS